MKRYQVKLVDYRNKGVVEYPSLVETDDRHVTFDKMAYVKKHENQAPYDEYDEVRVYENGVWIANMRLY